MVGTARSAALPTLQARSCSACRSWTAAHRYASATRCAASGERERPISLHARLIVETDEYCSFVDRLSFGHDRICREGFIRPAQRDTFHDDLISGYSGML